MILAIQFYERVFSTCVEVIPSSNQGKIKKPCILHVCGGDPQRLIKARFKEGYSPRVWR